jgi:glycerophosphoryl diester phosphodiesterase
MEGRPQQSARIGDTAERVFHRLANGLVRRWPRPRPPRGRLHTCRIVSHRGEHDNPSRLENTLAAFDAAADAGVWGLELDVRWTGDMVPVVFHDADTRRMFGHRLTIGRTPLATLRSRMPLIPTLSEVVGRYGGRQHLMIEIKAEPYPRPDLQTRRMRRLLADLCPGRDFHLMSLEPAMFAYFDFLDPQAFLPIGQLRMDRISRLALKNGWDGVAGHYLMTTGAVITRHHTAGQRVGAGFADSRRSLYREIHRGVDWIFSNRAAAMQAICKKC